MVTDLTVPKNDAELIEMERLMRSAPEPGGLPSGSIGEVGGDSVAIHTAKSQSAGHVTMWNTDTREPSVFNLNAVRTKLQEVFPANYEENPSMRGKACWTAVEPSMPPNRGSTTCLLHPDRPERDTYDVLGYPRCHFNVCANEMEAQRHLEKKHPSVHRMMQQLRDTVERDETIKNQGVLGQILAKMAGVDLAEPEVPDGFETFEIVHDSPSITTIVIDADPTVTKEEVSEHIHSFPKGMGSECKYRDCVVVRTTQFKARKKK